MKKLSSELSLPKLTHRNIEDLINLSKRSLLVNHFDNKNVVRLTHDRNQQINPFPRNNRFTDIGSNIDKRQFLQNICPQIQVKSALYERLHLQNSEKCPCEFHRMKRRMKIPQIRRSEDPHYGEVILKKIDDMKKHQINQANKIKTDHINIHKTIQANQLNYLSSSIHKSSRIKVEKQTLSKKNKTIIINKLEKAKSQQQLNKEFKQIFFKQKLQQIYQLDNQNEPFQEIIERINHWQSDKKAWTVKILRKIHRKLKKIKQTKTTKDKRNSLNHIASQNYNQNNLVDLQKCLPLILNNITSINQLFEEGICHKIEQILTKKLNNKAKDHGAKLIKQLGQIVGQILVEQSTKKKKKQLKLDDFKTKYNQIDSHSEHQFDISHYNTRNIGLQKITQSNESTKQTFLPTNCDNHLLNTNIEHLLNDSPLKINFDKGENCNVKAQTLIASKSTTPKKVSKLSFMSGTLNRNSKLSRKKEEIETQKSRFSNQANSLLSSKNTSEVMAEISDGIGTSSPKKSPLITPSLSKQVICQRQELNLSQQQDEQFNSDYDEDDQLAQKALKDRKSAYQIADEQQKQEVDRINGIIDYIKLRIRLRKANILIPDKYQQVRYQKFCSKSTFSYIGATIDDLNGVKKFRFLYCQLQLKKKIIEDDFVQEVIKQFAPMFPDEQQLNEWKKYLFEHRSKIMFQQLNRIIDLGVKKMDENKVQPIQSVKNLTGDSVGNQENECLIKFDQSQAAYERYMQKLQRAQIREKNTASPIQIDLGLKNRPETKQPRQQQLITQKTIDQDIETSSNKTILYSYIENKKQLQTRRRAQHSPQTQKHVEGGPENIQNKNMKKVLKYLLKKKPQQFQMLNKDINSLSRLISSNFKV